MAIQSKNALDFPVFFFLRRKMEKLRNRIFPIAPPVSTYSPCALQSSASSFGSFQGIVESRRFHLINGGIFTVTHKGHYALFHNTFRIIVRISNHAQHINSRFFETHFEFTTILKSSQHISKSS